MHYLLLNIVKTRESGLAEQRLIIQVSFKKEVGVMVNDLVFWLTVCLSLKMCY